jgi:hypothetical protein
MGPQSHRSPNSRNFETPIWEPGTNCHLDVAPVERHKVYYKGEGCGFPLVWVMVSLVNPKLPVVHLSTKSVQIMH